MNQKKSMNEESDDLEKKIREEFKNRVLPLKITQEAYEMIIDIAKWATLGKQDYEIAFYLLGSKDQSQNDLDKWVIRDIYLPVKQKITPTDFDIASYQLGDAQAYAAKKGMKVLGIGHSHYTMGSFHSEKDDGNLRRSVRLLDFKINEIGSVSYNLDVVFNTKGDPPVYAVSYIPVKYSDFYSYLDSEVKKGKKLTPIISYTPKNLNEIIVNNFEKIESHKLSLIKSEIEVAEHNRIISLKERLLHEEKDLLEELQKQGYKSTIIPKPSPAEIKKIEDSINSHLSTHVGDQAYDRFQNQKTRLDKEISEDLSTYKLDLNKLRIGQTVSLDGYISKIPEVYSADWVLAKAKRQAMIPSEISQKEEYVKNNYTHSKEEFEKLKQEVKEKEEILKLNKAVHYADLKARIEVMKENEEYRRTHQYSNEQFDSLQKRTSELESKISEQTVSYAAQLKQKTDELAKQKDEIKEYQQRIEQLGQRTTVAEESKKKAEQSRDSALITVSDLQQKVSEYETIIKTEEKDLVAKVKQEAKEEYDKQLQEKETQYQQKITELEQRARTAEQQRGTALQDATKSREKVAEYEDSLRQSKEKEKEYQQREQQYKQRFDVIQQRITATEQGVNKALTVVSELEKKVREQDEQLRKKDEEIERLKIPQKEKSLFGKIKNAAKTALIYSPVVGAVMKNDKVVDNVIQTLDTKIQNNKIDGKELYETMYKSGVNNISTKNAVKKKLEEKGVTIEGKVESKCLVQSKVVDFLNNKMGFKYIGDGLQIYKGENGSKWDAFKRNTKIGGEVSALAQAAAVTTFGYSMYQSASSVAQALEDRLKDTKYEGIASHPLAWATGFLAASAAINSGNITTIARSANSVYSQSAGFVSKGLGKLTKYLKKDENAKIKSKIGDYLGKVTKHSDKLAYLSQLAGQGFMLGTIADAAYAQYQRETAYITDPAKKHEPSPAIPKEEGKPEYIRPPIPEEVKPIPEVVQPKEAVIPPYSPTQDFSSSQLEELSNAGWRYVGDGKFEYRLNDEDQKFGRGISQILRYSDTIIGNDEVISKAESGRLAHIVAATPPSEVDRIGDGTFKDLRDPMKYVVHKGDRLYATTDVVKAFFT